jgi:hypothetical protein
MLLFSVSSASGTDLTISAIFSLFLLFTTDGSDLTISAIVGTPVSSVLLTVPQEYKYKGTSNNVIKQKILFSIFSPSFVKFVRKAMNNQLFLD